MSRGREHSQLGGGGLSNEVVRRVTEDSSEESA